jgi:hypothetical protein
MTTAFSSKAYFVSNSKNSCTVYVTTNSGNPAYYIKVVGSVCGGISCSGYTKEFRTDKSGKATVEWSSDCNLCAFFIDGKSRKGDFRNGGTYNFTL